jgi:GT2 family glycosyltransferase
MKTTIIIPAFNNANYTKKYLLALQKNTNSDFLKEIIVVNNASTDETGKLLETFKNIRVITEKKNINFAGACNVGARAAKGEILLFLNNDTEVQPGWLEPIMETVEKNNKIGAVGVKLLFPDESIQHAGLVFSADATPRHIYYRHNEKEPYVNKEREFKAVTAACIAIPKKVFDMVGGFDEVYKNGLEDVDICLKIHHLGYTIIYNPKSMVTHYESISSDRFSHSDQNAEIYMSRWSKEGPDENKYYREDGFSRLWILAQNLRSMSYGPDLYSTRPTWIKIARLFFIPANKIATFARLLLKGDFKKLAEKIGSLHGKS